MEVKLIKLGKDKYTLIYKEGDTSWEHNPELDGNLSLKNCQTIDNGYDLDELAEQNWRIGLEEYIPTPATHVTSFKAGFEKALEILSDKKFSEKDMKKAIHFGASWREQLFNGTTKTSELFESLQKTEWNVEVETTYSPIHKLEVFGNNNIEIHNITNESLKLDADGCLILKRK